MGEYSKERTEKNRGYFEIGTPTIQPDPPADVTLPTVNLQPQTDAEVQDSFNDRIATMIREKRKRNGEFEAGKPSIYRMDVGTPTIHDDTVHIPEQVIGPDQTQSWRDSQFLNQKFKDAGLKPPSADTSKPSNYTLPEVELGRPKSLQAAYANAGLKLPTPADGTTLPTVSLNDGSDGVAATGAVGPAVPQPTRQPNASPPVAASPSRSRETNPFLGGDPDSIVSYGPGSKDSETGKTREQYMTRGEAADRWFAEHGDPVNKLGYRESDWQNKLRAGYDTAKKVEAAGTEEVLANQRIEEHLQRDAEDAALRNAQRQQDEANRQAAVKQQMLNVELATDEAKKAELGGSSFLEKNPISGIMFALSAAIGGAYSGATGHENSGLRGLETAIQRDIEIQKYNLNKKQQNAANQSSLLGLMRQQFGDERDAERATEIAMRQLAADRLAGTAEGIKNVKMRNDVMLMADELRKSADNNKAEMMRALWIREHQAPSGGGHMLKSDDLARIVRLPDGRTIMAPTQKEAEAARNAIASAQKIRAAAGVINNARNSPDGYIKGTALGTKADIASKDIMLSLKQENGLGTLDKGMLEFSNDYLGDPNGLTSRAGQRANEIADRADKAVENVVRSWGGEQVDRGYKMGPDGSLQPAIQYQGQTLNPRPPMPASVKPGA